MVVEGIYIIHARPYVTDIFTNKPSYFYPVCHFPIERPYEFVFPISLLIPFRAAPPVSVNFSLNLLPLIYRSGSNEECPPADKFLFLSVNEEGQEQNARKYVM